MKDRSQKYNDAKWRTNRIKQRAARGRSSWCDRCDSYKVWDGQKCRNCGKRQEPKREKPGKA